MAISINPVDFRGFSLGAPSLPNLPNVGALGLQALQARMQQRDNANQLAAQQAMNAERIRSSDELGLRQLALERSKLDAANQIQRRELDLRNRQLGQQQSQFLNSSNLEDKKLGLEDRRLGLLERQSAAELGLKQDQLGLARNELDFNRQKSLQDSAKIQLQTEMAQLAAKKKEDIDNMGAFAVNAKLVMNKAQNPGDARSLQLEILKEAEQNGYISKDAAKQMRQMPISSFNNALEFKILQLNKVKEYQAMNKVNAAQSGDNITITRPDGTSVQVQGLTNTTQSQLQKDLLSKEGTIKQFEQLEKGYNPEYFTFKNQASAEIAKGAEKTKGIPLVEQGLELLSSTLSGKSKKEQEDFIKQRSSYMNKINQVFNAYKKEITGAAAGEKEIDQIKASFLNGDMSPSEFKGALQQVVDKYKDEASQIRQTLKEGQTVSSPNRNYFYQGLKAKGYSDDEINSFLSSKGL